MTRLSNEAKARWDQVSSSHRDYVVGIHELLQAHRDEVVGLIEQGFRHPMDASIAVGILPTLTLPERQALLPLMLSLCHPNGYPHIARPFILELPREWVIANVETAAEPILAGDDYLDWCNLLGLYEELDSSLARRFAVQMTKHPDAEIRADGASFLDQGQP